MWTHRTPSVRAACFGTREYKQLGEPFAPAFDVKPPLPNISYARLFQLSIPTFPAHRRYWEVDLWDNLFTVLLNADYRATDIAGTDLILSRLEDSLASYLGISQRSRELQECLRKQDNMLSGR